MSYASGGKVVCRSCSSCRRARHLQPLPLPAERQPAATGWPEKLIFSPENCDARREVNSLPKGAIGNSYILHNGADCGWDTSSSFSWSPPHEWKVFKCRQSPTYAWTRSEYHFTAAAPLWENLALNCGQTGCRSCHLLGAKWHWQVIFPAP